MSESKPIKFVFKRIGEAWGYNVPKVETFENVEDRKLLNDYTGLEVGDILESRVGHFDYNTATFAVELTVRNKVVEDDGTCVNYLYVIELSKWPATN